MPKSSTPSSKPRDTDEILREMEELSTDINSTIAGLSPSDARHSGASHHQAPKREGGALKSLLGFFVSVEPDEAATADEALSSTGSDARQAAGAMGEASGGAASGSSGQKRVGDLVAGESAPEFAPPETNAGDLAAKPLAEIYSEAGITDSPCSVDDLATLLANPAVTNQPMSVKVVAVKLTLSAKGIGADVPVADAVRRDRTLDAYQQMLAARARATEERNTALIEQLTKEAEEYLKRKQAEMDALRAETSEVNRQSVDFSLRREAEEKRMAELISPFLEGKPTPITIGN